MEPVYGSPAYWQAVTDGRISWEEAEQATSQAQVSQGVAGRLATLRTTKSAGRAPTPGKAQTARPRKARPRSLGPKLTRSARDLLDVLGYLADQARYSAAKVELAARVGVHEDTIRRGLRQLEGEGLILTYHRPGPRPDLDRPNLYAITPAGWAMLNRRPPAALMTTLHADRPIEEYQSSTAKLRHPSAIEKNNVTQKETPSAPSRAAERSPGAPASTSSPLTDRPTTEGMASPAETRKRRKEVRQDGEAVFKEADRSISLDAPPTGPKSAEPDDQRRDNSNLAWRAVQALLPNEKRGNLPADCWRILDRERSIRLSKYNSLAWERALAAHGRDTALMAAAVAMLRRTTAAGRKIQSRAGYLGSMLKKPDLDARASLRAILD